jgi:hypothetical protein
VHFDKATQISSCHILYIGQSEAGRLDQDLAVIKGKAILTVSEIETSSQHGVMIRLANEKNKIRLKINADAARGAKLTLSSKLLRAADIVPGK